MAEHVVEPICYLQIDLTTNEHLTRRAHIHRLLGQLSLSRYITSCQTTTELTEQPMDMRSARKVLIGGQIYLQVADGLYNMLGQKVNGK